MDALSRAFYLSLNKGIQMSEYRKGAISLERLKHLLVYNPNSGIFIWKIANGRRIKIGDTAGGYDSGGYLQIRIDGIKYRAHRLAWFYMTGEWPEFEIDHKDCITDNNKWLNLRKATHSQNSKNRSLNINSTTQLKGVYKRGSKWRSKISINGVQTNLGTFDSPEEAHAAYLAAAGAYHGEFANSGKGF